MSVRFCSLTLVAVGFVALAVAEVSAQAVVVQPGDNLQAVINDAPEGAALTLAAGAHRGPVTIAQPMTLRGADGARLEGAQRGSVLTIEADDVRVERLEIRGSGRDLSTDDAGVLVIGDRVHLSNLRLRGNLHGIYVRGGKHANIADNDIEGLAATEQEPKVRRRNDATRDDGIHHSPPRTASLLGNGIHLFDADGVTVTDNRIRHARDGIYVAHSSNARFHANDVRDCRYGIHYMYSHRNTLDANVLSRNVAGAALMFSRNLDVANNMLRDHAGFRAYGLLLQDVDYSTFQGNQMRGNRVGLRLQNSNANTFRGNEIVGNITGLRMGSASRDNVMTRNRIGPSLHQVELTGPAPPTEWAVDGVGNRWHGAMPLDLTGDGIANWPHHEVDVLADRREAFAPVQLLTASAGIRVLEWALRRAPIPGMRYITDPHPIVRGHADD